MALRNKNIANSHIVTHTYYLRPTGQSKILFFTNFLCTRNILGGFPQLDIVFTYKHTWGLRPHMRCRNTRLVFSTTLESTPLFGYLSAHISYYKFRNTRHFWDISMLSLSNPPGFGMDLPDYPSGWLESSIIERPHIPLSLVVFGKAFSNQVKIDLWMVNLDP